jgi:gluconolactonase
MRKFITDIGFPEAPVLLADGSHLFTSMLPETGWVVWVSEDGSERRVVAKTGRPNGLAVDRKGSIWVAETSQRALLKLQLSGESHVFARNEGAHQPFYFLNDLAFAPNADLYLTDSGVLEEDFAPNGVMNPEWDKLRYDGRVYRVDPSTGSVETIDQGIRFTNGIAFGPDQNLYIAETLTGMIHRYEWKNGAIIGARQPFGNVIDPQGPEGIRGPDGMKFGADGNLYVAVFGQGNITVLNPQGQVARRIKTDGLFPTNLHFGALGERCIYVTEAQSASVQIIDVGTDGLALHA